MSQTSHTYIGYPHHTPQTASSSTPIPQQPATATSAPLLPTLPPGMIDYTENDDQVYKTRYFAIKHLVQAVEDENNMLAYKLAQMTARCQRIEFDRVIQAEHRKQPRPSHAANSGYHADPGGSSAKAKSNGRGRASNGASRAGSAYAPEGKEYLEEQGGSRRGSLADLRDFEATSRGEDRHGRGRISMELEDLAGGPELASHARRLSGSGRDQSRSELYDNRSGGQRDRAYSDDSADVPPSTFPYKQTPALPLDGKGSIPVREVGEDEDELMDDY